MSPLADVMFDHTAADQAVLWCRRRAVLLDDAAAALAHRGDGLDWHGPAAVLHESATDEQTRRLRLLARDLRLLADRIERGAEAATTEQRLREARRRRAADAERSPLPPDHRSRVPIAHHE